MEPDATTGSGSGVSSRRDGVTLADLGLKPIRVALWAIACLLGLVAVQRLTGDTVHEVVGTDKVLVIAISFGVLLLQFLALASSIRWIRSPARRRLALRVVAITVPLSIAAPCILTAANAHFDTSEPFLSEWLVLDLGTPTGDGSRSLVEVARADTGERVGTLPVESDFARSLVPGRSRIVLTSGDGAFGWRRLIHVEAQPLPSNVDVAAERLAYLEANSRERPGSAGFRLDVPRLLAIPLAVGLALLGMLLVWRRRLGVRALSLAGRRRWFGIDVSRHGREFTFARGTLRLFGTDPGFLLTASRTTEVTRFALRLGLVRQPASGDPDFDAKFLVETQPPERALALVTSPTFRGLIVGQLQGARRPAPGLRIDERGLLSVCPLLASPLDELESRLRGLSELDALIARTAARPRRSWTPLPPSLLVAALVALLMVLAAALPLLFATSTEMPQRQIEELLLIATATGAGAGVLSVPMAFWLTRRRAMSGRLAAVCLMGAPLITMIVTGEAVMSANWLLDTSPVRRVDTRLLGYRADKMLLAPWDGSDTPVDRMYWPWDEPAPPAPADVVVLLQDGALGYQRIVGVEPLDP